MINFLIRLFSQLKNNCSLSYEGSWDGDFWGTGILKNNDVSYRVDKGITRFVTENMETWGDSKSVESSLSSYLEFHKMSIDDYIHSIFKAYYDNEKALLENKSWINEIVSDNKHILEIACGPSGGLSPLILKQNPNAKILMNDLSFFILNQWNLIKKKYDFHNLYFSLFDLTNSPLKDKTFDIITSILAFESTCNPSKAIQESYRMLKQDGVLYSKNFEFTKNTKNQFSDSLFKAILQEKEVAKIFNPQALITILKQKKTTSILTDLNYCGFRIKDYETIQQLTILPEESEIAKALALFDISLESEYIKIKAIK